MCCFVDVFFFQAEDGIRDLVRSRGLGDVYKRQINRGENWHKIGDNGLKWHDYPQVWRVYESVSQTSCLFYKSDAADERSSVDLGGRRIIKKKKNKEDTS